MKPKDLIGKTVYYRPYGKQEIKESRVVSARNFMNLTGNIETILKMENGDEEEASAVYFEIEISTVNYSFPAQQAIIDVIVQALYHRDESLVRVLKSFLSDQRHNG